MKAKSIDSGMASRDDEPAAQVAEHQEEHGHDEQPALEQVLLDRRDRAPDEVGPVVEGLDHDARRQALLHARRASP